MLIPDEWIRLMDMPAMRVAAWAAIDGIVIRPSWHDACYRFQNIVGNGVDIVAVAIIPWDHLSLDSGDASAKKKMRLTEVNALLDGLEKSSFEMPHSHHWLMGFRVPFLPLQHVEWPDMRQLPLPLEIRLARAN